MKKLFFSLTAVLFLTSCTIYQGHFTILSNKSLDQCITNSNSVPKIYRGVVGIDREDIMLIFPTDDTEKLDDAIDDVLKKYDADLMTDTNILQWAWYIPFLCGSAGWKVKGNAVRIHKGWEDIENKTNENARIIQEKKIPPPKKSFRRSN